MSENCPSGKYAFKTRGDAQKAMKRMRNNDNLKRSAGSGGKIYCYECRQCGSFHHGHDVRRIVRKVKLSRYKE